MINGKINFIIVIKEISQLIYIIFVIYFAILF